MDNLEPPLSPSVPQSVLPHARETFSTIIISPISPRTALPDLENLFGDVSLGAQSTSQSNSGPSASSPSIDTNGTPVNQQQHASASDPQETSTRAKDESLGASYQGLPKEAKIGIIVGIVVVVLLAVLGCGMCFLDCRRRQKKRREKRDARDGDVLMLEMEMRNGHTGQQKLTQRGLWDHLKPANGKDESKTGLVPPADAAQAKMTFESSNTRKDSTIGSVGSARHGSDAGLSQAHFSRDRGSVVSSVPSLTSSSGGMPALPGSFLGGGLRR